MNNVSIVIVTYNSELYIEECINSIIEKTSKVSYEIIVIDNASKDRTVSIIKEKFPNIKLIINEKNMGFAKAVKQSRSIVKGKYIFLLNPDTKLKNEVIDILYSTAERNNEFVLFGSKLVDDCGKYLYSCGYLPTPNEILLLYLLKGKFIKPRRININAEQKVEIISGANFFVRKEIFDQLAGFDEDYFMYLEEIDFCFRLKKQNLSALYVPSANIIHYENKSQVNIQITNMYKLVSSYLYCVKNFKNINKGLFKIIFIVILLFQICLSKCQKEYNNALLTIIKS